MLSPIGSPIQHRCFPVEGADERPVNNQESGPGKLSGMVAFCPGLNIPTDLAVAVLKKLPPEDVCRSSRVCRVWRLLASDSSLWNAAALKRQFPKLEVLDKELWQSVAFLRGLGLSLEDASPFDVETYKVLKSLFAQLQVEGDAGIALLTIPKGLTLNKLVSLAQLSKRPDRPIKFDISKVPQILRDLPTSKTCHVILTRASLQGMRGVTIESHNEILDLNGFKMIGALPGSALVILTCLSARDEPPACLFANPNVLCCFEERQDVEMILGSNQKGAIFLSLSMSIEPHGIGAQRTLQ